MDATPAEVVVALTCWKDIASYLGKGVRTVQRWEQDFGLPVRRPNGVSHKSPVAADPRDLDAWLKSRWSLRAEKAEGAAAFSRQNGESAKTRSELLERLEVTLRRSAALRAALQLSRREYLATVRKVATNTISLSRSWQLAISTPPVTEKAGITESAAHHP